jgi:hypothetical protein
MPVLSDLYQLKEEFFRIYDAGCEQDAYERYLIWQQHIPPSFTSAFLLLQLTVEKWKAIILLSQVSGRRSNIIMMAG